MAAGGFSRQTPRHGISKSKVNSMNQPRLTALYLTLLGLLLTRTAGAGEYLNGIEWEEPKKVTPGKTNSDAPSDAIVLFDGKNLDAWKNGDRWKVEDGVATVGRGGIVTKQEFGDCQLHIEWMAVNPPKGKGQGCSNSGVFMMGKYEVQILDSFTTDTYFDGQAGAIYKQTPPAVNATRKPGEWNTYDIIWTCPRFDKEGKVTTPAHLTVLHNGVLIQNSFPLLGDTPYNRPPAYKSMGGKGPIMLQDHGNPVKFRNIWVREIKPAQGKQVRDPYLRQGDKEIPIKTTEEEVTLSGSVSLDGKPLSSGSVRFFPQKGGEEKSAEIDEQGRFQFKESAGFGPGEYRVFFGKDIRIPAKYHAKKTSGLSVQVVEGKNELKFELTVRN